MAVHQKVDALYVGQQVNGAVGLAACVDAQVGQTHDEVTVLGFQCIHGGLDSLVHGLALEELQAFDELGVGLRSGLGSGHAHEAHLETHFGLHDVSGVKNGLAGLLVHQSGADEREVHGCGLGVQVLAAIVKLMVAGSSHIVAHSVHESDSRSALIQVDQGSALEEVTGVYQDDFSACGLKVGHQLGNASGAERAVCGILVVCIGQLTTVNVVGVYDDKAAFHAVCCGGDFQGSSGQDQGKYHSQCQQEGEGFFRPHVFPPFFGST